MTAIDQPAAPLRNCWTCSQNSIDKDGDARCAVLLQLWCGRRSVDPDGSALRWIQHNCGDPNGDGMPTKDADGCPVWVHDDVSQ